MKEILPLLRILVFGAIMSGCKVEKKPVAQLKVILPMPPFLLKKAPQVRSKDRLIIHIKKNINSVKTGMSKPEVMFILHLDIWFKGIVTSEGNRDQFYYYYDLKGYQLLLSFDYTYKKAGELRNCSLNVII